MSLHYNIRSWNLISPIGEFRIHQYTSSFKDYAYVSLKYDIVMFDLSEGNDEHLR